MKTILLASIILLGIAIPVSATQDQCPKGSYQIDVQDGKPVCKAEPTGCPYADGIPKDSIKCVPPKEEATPAETPLPSPAPVEESYTQEYQDYGGK